MEPDKVRKMAAFLQQTASILRVVSTVLEAQMRILDATAFIGNVGGAAVARYIEVIQPAIEKLSKDLTDRSEEAIKSAKDWEDATG